MQAIYLTHVYLVHRSIPRAMLSISVIYLARNRCMNALSWHFGDRFEDTARVKI